MSLKRHAVNALVWSSSDELARRIIGLLTVVVLARLLTPAEFGLMALIYLFVGVAEVFADGGLSWALVQQKQSSHLTESTVFWMNLVLGVVAAAMLGLVAPGIAYFYKEEILIPLLLLLAVSVFFNALGAIHTSLLTRKLNFRLQMGIGLVSSVLSGVVTILMAIKGYGVWSLAAQAVSLAIFNCALLWMFNPWRPEFAFSVESLSRVGRFSGFMLASRILDVIYSRLYTVLVGKLFGVRELGYFNRADSVSQFPIGVFTRIIARVAFPVFSRLQDDADGLRNATKHAIRGIMLVNAPVMIGLMALSEPTIQVLLGAQWLPSAPIFMVLCLGAVFWPLHIINLNLLMAQGHADLYFRLEILKKVLGSIFLLLGSFFGVMGIAWSIALFSVFGLMINLHYSGKFLGYGLLGQMRDVMPALAVAIGAGVLIALCEAYLEWPALAELLVLAPLVVVMNILGARIFRLKAMEDTVTMLRSHFDLPR